MALVTVYTRQGCHLCEVAEQVVARLTAGTAHRVELVDVDAGDPALRDAYTVRVPVVAVDGVEVAQYQVDERALAAVLG